jgi:hypothetical protein
MSEKLSSTIYGAEKYNQYEEEPPRFSFSETIRPKKSKRGLKNRKIGV